MNKIAIAFLALILIGILMPVGFSSDSDSVVIMYGEITQNNPEYKDFVNEYFTNMTKINTKNTNNKVITQKNVNDMLGRYVDESYLYGHISSAVLLDLNGLKDLNVTVDRSKITVVTPEMYESALESAGITKGKFYLTSPFEINGDVELTGMLMAYESQTNIEIPDSVERAVNFEIFTQAGIVESSNVTSQNLTKLVSVCKKKMTDENIKNQTEIIKIINNYTKENNITLKNQDNVKLSNALIKVQSVQDDVKIYKIRLQSVLDDSTISQYSINNLIN